MSTVDIRMLRRVACGIAAGWLSVACCAQQVVPVNDRAKRFADTLPVRDLAWRAMPAEARPEFRGVVSYDTAGGGAGAMLYPAPGAAGLLVAILTHAALNEGARSAETKRIEEAADQVLTPLQSSIGKLQWRELQQAAIARLELGLRRRLVMPDEAAGDAWLVEAQPVFRMSQDKRALVAETLVRIFDGGASVALVEREVRVVAPPVRADDPDAYWTAQDGTRLADTGAALAAEAIRAALLDAQAADDLPQKTVRFVEGAADRFERAAPLTERCGRVVLRTLRGGVMSVPLRPKAGADATAGDVTCGAAWPDAGMGAVAVAAAAPAAAPPPEPAAGPEGAASTASPPPTEAAPQSTR
jgi:hypothetical protein